MVVRCLAFRLNTVSYAKFPDPGTAEKHITSGYYDDVQYQR